MKYILISIVFFLSIKSFCQSQIEMTKQSAEALKKEERQLNSIYNKVLRTYSSDNSIISSLKGSQSLWKKYYLAQVDLMFPKSRRQNSGTIISMCVTQYSRKLVKIRIKELEAWLIGNDEEGCPGSIRQKDKLPIYEPYVFEED